MRVRWTGLTDVFDYAAYLQQHGERTIPLFAFDPCEHMHLFSLYQDWQPGPG